MWGEVNQQGKRQAGMLIQSRGTGSFQSMFLIVPPRKLDIFKEALPWSNYTSLSCMLIKCSVCATVFLDQVFFTIPHLVQESPLGISQVPVLQVIINLTDMWHMFPLLSTKHNLYLLHIFASTILKVIDDFNSLAHRYRRSASVGLSPAAICITT